MKSSPESLIHPWESQEQFLVANDNVRFGQAPESFPDLSSVESGRGDGTVIRFILWAHVPKNQRHVIPLIEGCDILAMEAVNLQVYEDVTDRQKAQSGQQDVKDALSILVTGQVDPKAAQRMARRDISPERFMNLSPKKREKSIKEYSPNVYGDVLAHFAGRLEKIVNLDTELKDAKKLLPLIDAGIETEKALSEAARDPSNGWQQLNTYALDNIRAFNASNLFRERLVKRQLEGLARENPGKTIGVLYGLGHQLLTRQIEAPGVRLQRQFAGDHIERDPLFLRTMSQDMYLENSLRAGIYNQDAFDRYIALSLAEAFAGGLARISVASMDSERLDLLTGQLKAVWQEPIKSEDAEAAQLMKQRRAQTAALFKNPLGIRGLLGRIGARQHS